MDTTERGDKGVKGGPKTGWRQGYFTHNSTVFFCFFFQFCDVATFGDHPQGDLATFDYKPAMKVNIY